MGFKIMYYVTIACPTVDKTLEMIDKYVERGVNSLQIDMPSSDPFGETDFVKEMMKNGLKNGYSYDDYMDAIRKVRAKYPDVDLSIVVYPDVIESIGLDRYMAFLKEIGAKDNILCTDEEALFRAFDENGLTYMTNIPYNDPEYGIEQNERFGEKKDHIITMRTRRRTDAVNRRFDSWKDRVKLAREGGLACKLYAVADVQTAEDVAERKEAGLDGVIIGNVLMRLWDDEEELWKRLAAFESYVEE